MPRQLMRPGAIGKRPRSEKAAAQGSDRGSGVGIVKPKYSRHRFIILDS